MASQTLNQRRWRNFKANRRAWYSLIIFSVLYGLSLFAEVLANDHPLLVSYQGHLRAPFLQFFSEASYGGDFQTEANYRDPVVQCLIRTGGVQDCFDTPEDILKTVDAGTYTAEGYKPGWLLWPPIPYSFNTINDLKEAAPTGPDRDHWLGTDDTSRDVLARVIYGFRISVSFGLIVAGLSSVIGIIAGAIQGYFGGLTDLIFQRVMEIWSSTPMLYVIIILGAIWQMSFVMLMVLMVAFSWMGLVGLVRAEFLRVRNFEYVRAAKALGVSDWVIMRRHLLPNATVSTTTMMPFVVTGAIGSLTGLDYLGFGLPPSYPSLGEMARQAQQNLNAYHLTFTAFIASALMLCLLIFIFEGVRDAFDPRKTFR
jgi:microcin C transport system permease protein